MNSTGDPFLQSTPLSRSKLTIFQKPMVFAKIWLFFHENGSLESTVTKSTQADHHHGRKKTAPILILWSEFWVQDFKQDAVNSLQIESFKSCIMYHDLFTSPLNSCHLCRLCLGSVDEDGSVCGTLQPAVEHQRCSLLVQSQPGPDQNVQGWGTPASLTVHWSLQLSSVTNNMLIFYCDSILVLKEQCAYS